MNERKTEEAFAIAIHGGAGAMSTLTPDQVEDYHKGLEAALSAGRDVLAAGGTAMDAVIAAVQSMEENPLFNCGKGSVFNHAGFHELDASVMDGKTLGCGAVAGVRTVKSPIHLARLVMEQSPHVFMAGQGVEEFASAMNVERVDNSYFSTEIRRKQWENAVAEDKIRLDHDGKNEKMGTVGAVAMDKAGNLAAATSTGGVTNKKFGRVGDSPVIGAGTYANNETCAVSCTGQGEEFIRRAVAFDIHAQMHYGNRSFQDAANEVVFHNLPEGSGGLIAIDNRGNVAMPFNTRGMFRGTANSSGEFRVATFAD